MYCLYTHPGDNCANVVDEHINLGVREGGDIGEIFGFSIDINVERW